MINSAWVFYYVSVPFKVFQFPFKFCLKLKEPHLKKQPKFLKEMTISAKKQKQQALVLIINQYSLCINKMK